VFLTKEVFVPIEGDATPQTAALVATATEQPAAQAVSATPVSPASEPSVAPTAQPAATDATPSAPVAPSPLEQELETLRKRYADSSAEALRLYRENEAMKAAKPSQPTQATPPSYTPEQLETWKEQWLVKAATDPAAAQEAAHQVRLIDAELRKVEFSRYESTQTSRQAYQKLEAEVMPIIKEYQADLQPGTPVYNLALQLHKDAVTAGAPDNQVTATSATLLALAKSGKFQAGVAAKASQAATANLNQALKSAAAAGSGAANHNAAATPDFKKMTPAQFRDYRKGLGVES
jgi:hypothetical protein